MGKQSFHMEQLEKFEEFDASRAELNFQNREAYFDALSRFVEEAAGYLQTYMPMVVVNSDDVRRQFLRELQQVRSALLLLGMKKAANGLDLVEEAALGKDEKILSDGILKFHCEMDILAKRVAAVARPVSDEKPLIMAVDDMPMILAAMNEMLKEHFRLLTVTNADDVVKALEKHEPDLFLLDIEMPEVKGYELAKWIRGQERFANTPILFLTSMGTKDYVIAAKENGGDDYILKSTSQNVLLKKINWHLNERKNKIL